MTKTLRDSDGAYNSGGSRPSLIYLRLFLLGGGRGAHCTKLLLLYSKSDCKYTELIAVGKSASDPFPNPPPVSATVRILCPCNPSGGSAVVQSNGPLPLNS